MAEIFDKLFSDSDDSPKFKVLESLLKPDALNFKTELSDKEIRAYAISEYVDKYFNKIGIDLGLKRLMQIAKELKVSRRRKGRQEIIQALINTEDIPKMYQNRLKQVLGI